MSKLPEWKDLPDWSQTIFIVSVVVVAGVTGVSVPTLLKSTDSTKEEPPKEVPTPTTPNPESQKVELGIYVKNDKDNNPIEDAKVRLEPPNSSPETKKTNEDGYITFTIPKGVKIQVIITKEKFKKTNKTYDDTIDTSKTRTYYLTPETDISSVKPSSSPLLITGTSPPASTSKPYIPPIKPSPIRVTKPAPLASKTSTPKPYITPIKPSPSVIKTAPQENSNNLELALLDRFKIEVFF